MTESRLNRIAKDIITFSMFVVRGIREDLSVIDIPFSDYMALETFSLPHYGSLGPIDIT